MPNKSNAYRSGRYGRFLPTVLALGDVILLNAIFLVVLLLNPDLDLHHRSRTIWLTLNIAMIPTAILSAKMHAIRTLHTENIIMDVLKGVGMHAILFAALLTFLRLTFLPLEFFLEFYIAALVAFPLAWLLVKRIVKNYRRQGRNYRTAIIIGTGETAMRVNRNLTVDTGYGLRINGFFGTQHPEGFSENYLGDVNTLADYLNENHVDEIYFTDSNTNEKYLKTVIDLADDNFCKFYYIPPLSRYVKRNFYLVPLNSSLPALTLHPNPLSSQFNRLVKRAFDVAFSSLVLLFTPILLPPIAIAIKCSSPGPIFFRQKRTGYRGLDFYCYKFRTMKVNADSDSRQATKDDDRKTAVGNFLRHTSIDELPQFWNVLKGDMSVVGPRPHMLAHTEEYRKLISQYMVRHLVKPGITGWAQIQGYRGATSLEMMEKRVDLDVWYIEHWSFMLDIKIIARTVINAASGEENAY